MNYAIEFDGVKKIFRKGGFTLDLPHMDVPEGYVTGFIGENGAGKTTCLKLLMHMLFADQGSVRLFGQEVSEDHAALREQVGYVGEETGYLQQAKLSALVDMVRPFYSNWDDKAMKERMEQFSLNPDKRHKELSKGQQKQFAVAMALAHHPKLLLLDEPTANLDPLVRDDILQMLSDLLEREEITIFFSTHITSDLDKIADYLRFLHKGRLLLEGAKDDILESHRIVKAKKELLCDEVRQSMLSLEQKEYGFSGLTRDVKGIYELLGKEAIYEKPSVEDLFLGYTKGERRNW